ncbi:MAG TPA: AMMECR1 domain-containing protein [Sulfuricurvum sp.]|nr:AMMECR1 domain-containing protein [Sulfuricurvum sp.]
MSQSVLLTIARESIQEVLQAQLSIDRAKLLEEYPLLEQPIATQVTLYVDGEIRGSSRSQSAERSLLEDIILNAKRAAFQDPAFIPISTSEYLHSAVELILFTADGPLSHKDDPILAH